MAIQQPLEVPTPGRLGTSLELVDSWLLDQPQACRSLNTGRLLSQKHHFSLKKWPQLRLTQKAKRKTTNPVMHNCF